MEDPILYVGRIEHRLTQLIHEYGDYLYLIFTWCCLFAIAWLLFRKRKSRHPEPASTNTPAIVGIIVASPGMSSDADGGHTRLIIGGDPSRN